jgi:predicted NBD/HSP70 family sugar kinase
MLINALCLQACLLGGGVSAAGPALLDRVQAHLPDFT